ncbi:hypothetical protein MJO28_009963 [Puccinia striiformis f. sp. tritici]|uniref:Uncharacterized protein n=1 Tax=Puccinia striiformis f. sp. tritici TaxID=168172 RepID=A0ACC0EA75_9BASI|nr:hypothetical protein MJO28_009963 [Puccinia striiformis f. sp. tritici]
MAWSRGCAMDLRLYLHAQSKTIGGVKPGMKLTNIGLQNRRYSRLNRWLTKEFPIKIIGRTPPRWTAVTRDGKRSAQFEETVLTAKPGWKSTPEFEAVAFGLLSGSHS